MSDRDIYQILESLDAAQKSVRQLPALFKPAQTSPQLSGPYPGQNATRGYMVGEGEEQPENPMAQAVIRRIANQHPEWLMKYGPEAVQQAVADATEGEDDWEEIGSSDVSAFVNMVGDRLRDYYGSRGEMADRKPFAEGIQVVDQDYDLDQRVLTMDVNGQRAQFTYTDYDEDFENAERRDVFDQLQRNDWYARLDHPTRMEILDAAYKAIRGEEPSEYRPTVDDEPLDEQGVAEGKDISDMEMHRLNVERFRKDLGLPDIDKPKKNRETDMDIHQKNVERFRKDLGLDKNKGVAEGLSKQFEIIYLDQSGNRKRKIVSGTSKEAVARQFKKQYKLEIEQVKQLQQGVKESLQAGEYHLATVTLDDGTTHKVKIRSDEGFREPIERHFKKQGRKVTDIDVDYSVRSDVYEGRDTATEDVLSTMKKKLGDYLQDVATAIKKDPDLVDQIPDDVDQIRAVKTLRTDDGHEIKIHGNEDDGFRISIKNRDAKTTFRDLDEATMAVEMYCARRRQAALEADYIDEKTS